MNKIPDIFVGTFQISGQREMDNVVIAAVSSAASKPYGFDTAPSYSTESLLGNSISSCIAKGMAKREDFFIQDKIDAMQMYWVKKRGLKGHVSNQLKQLHVDYLDSLLVHWPFEEFFSETWMNMVSLKKEGYVRHIGVCNLDERGFLKLFANINHDEIDIIQNEIHPFNADVSGVDFFTSKNYIVESYSPLCRMNRMVSDCSVLKEIAAGYGIDIGSIILKWHIQRGIHPIFTSRNPDRIKNNLNLNFILDDGAMSQITNLDQQYKIFPISHGCPGY